MLVPAVLAVGSGTEIASSPGMSSSESACMSAGSMSESLSETDWRSGMSSSWSDMDVSSDEDGGISCRSDISGIESNDGDELRSWSSLFMLASDALCHALPRSSAVFGDIWLETPGRC